MRTVLATAALLALTSAASAYCPSLPDTRSTRYVENATALAVCLQDELGTRVARQQQLNDVAGDVSARLKTLQLDLEARQAAATTLPPLPSFTMP